MTGVQTCALPIYLEAGIDLEGGELILGREPLVGPAALSGLIEGGQVGIIDFGGLPQGGGPDGLVAVGHHQVEVPHGGKEIEVAIARIAPARVVEGVEWEIGRASCRERV